MSPIVRVAVINDNPRSAGYSRLRELRSFVAQTHRQQGLTALDVIRKCPPDLRDKPPPVLRVSQGS